MAMQSKADSVTYDVGHVRPAKQQDTQLHRPLRCMPAQSILRAVLTASVLFLAYRWLLSHMRCEKPSLSGISAPERSYLAVKYALINENFPDPCFIESNGTFYAFATRNSSAVNVQVASANNIRQWTLHAGIDALPDPGPWAAKHLRDIAVWAPSVVEVNSTYFVLYYSALAASHPQIHCIGAAVATSVLGPYHPSQHPLVCDFALGGAIDPQFFHDPLTHRDYLLYKVDGNNLFGSGGACGNSILPNTPTPIMALPLSPDSLTTNTAPSFELVTNQPRDGAYLENPIMWYRPFPRNHNSPGYAGAYHLLFNAGCFTDASYRIEHVVCPADPRYGMEGCDWNHLRSHKPHSKRPYAGKLLQTGDTKAKCMAPGGPTVALRGSRGEVNQRYLGFHADAHVEWFGSGEPLVGGSRRRAFFVAELEYPETMEGIELGRLLEPLEGRIDSFV